MMSTATALTKAKDTAASGPNITQARQVGPEAAITAGKPRSHLVHEPLDRQLGALRHASRLAQRGEHDDCLRQP